MKENILNLEGIDKSGKDTVRSLVVKNSGGKLLVKVRTYISQIVYSRIYDRKIDEGFFVMRMKEDFYRGDKFVLLTADDKTIKERCLRENERDIGPSDVAVHKKQFMELLDELEREGIKVHIIDTSYESPERTAEKILELFED